MAALGGVGTRLCFIHVAKCGGRSITQALENYASQLGLSRIVHVHFAEYPPGCARQNLSATIVRTCSGPYKEGLPAYDACAATRRILLWVRDPVSRFLSAWHMYLNFHSTGAAVAKWASTFTWLRARLGSLTGRNASAHTVDLNQAFAQLASADGGVSPGQLTRAFITLFGHGPYGLAAYVPDCSRDFLRRQPFVFVGRQEYMLEDWKAFWRPRSAAAPRAERHTLPYAQERLTRKTVSWLRAFFSDDFRCLASLEESQLLARGYVAEVSSDENVYNHWPYHHRLIGV